MEVRISKWSILDVFLWVDIVAQVTLCVISAFVPTDTMNLVVFYNNYVLLAFIVIALMQKGVVANYLVIAFYLCFFIFLMGQKLFKDQKNEFLTFAWTVLSTRQFSVFVTIMAVGLISTYVFYIFFYINHRNQLIVDAFGMKDTLTNKNLIRILYFLTMPMALYMQLKIVSVRSSLSYTDGYLVNVDLPIFIKVGNYLYLCFSMMYLAMKPTKGEMFFVVFMLLFIDGGMQMLQGRRALFASTVIFLLWYLLKYYHVRRIKPKYYIVFAVGAIMMVTLFYFVEMRRGGLETGGEGLLGIVKSFMSSTGGSDSVIANTIVQYDNFPKPGIVYLLNPIVENPIVIQLSGKASISQGYEYVKNFDSFAHWISYLTSESLYCSGHGMGSCYLAEAFLALGIVGLIGVSAGIGFMFSTMSHTTLLGSIYKRTLIFIMIRNLFTLPRDGLFSWFGNFVYVLVGLLMYYVIDNIMKLRKTPKTQE